MIVIVIVLVCLFACLLVCAEKQTTWKRQHVPIQEEIRRVPHCGRDGDLGSLGHHARRDG